MGESISLRLLRFDSTFLANAMINTIKISSKNLLEQITNSVVHTIGDGDRIRRYLPEFLRIILFLFGENCRFIRRVRTGATADCVSISKKRSRLGAF